MCLLSDPPKILVNASFETSPWCQTGDWKYHKYIGLRECTLRWGLSDALKCRTVRSDISMKFQSKPVNTCSMMLLIDKGQTNPGKT